MSIVNMLGIEVETLSRKYILENIKKNIQEKKEFLHVVSLNPESLVVAQENKEFKQIIETAQIKIFDGVGVALAARFLTGCAQERVTGTGLMNELIKGASEMRLRVLLIGGRPNLALRLAQCYSQAHPNSEFIGLEGIKDIQNPTSEEQIRIFSIITDMRPHLVFVSFGSPWQEIWIDRHSKEFGNTVVMGVGGAFDFLGGEIPRAPKIIRQLGFEWLFRLFLQPWRWRRQMRLIKFIWFILKEKFFMVRETK